MNCYVFIPGNEQGKRIGIVKWYETGYYVTNYDHHTNEANAREHVKLLNEKLGIPADVAESALYGSMFGWNAPCAKFAIDFEQNKK